MKKYLSLAALVCMPLLFSSQALLGTETPAPVKETSTSEPQKPQLKEPFSRMTPAEMASTGIQKLTSTEQEALAKWWYQHKISSHQHAIAKEVSITSIASDGKTMVLSDGSKISFGASARKKVMRWSVGDKLGLGEPGKRGAVAIYHLASGQKVNGKREQAPQNPTATEQKSK